MAVSHPKPEGAPLAGPPEPAIVGAVRRLFSLPNYRPPMLPRAALQVMQVSQRLDVDFLEVSRLIESDTFFAAQVLRVANSPLYGSAKIATISQALVRLGMQTMSDICLDAAMRGRVFRAPGLDSRLDALSRHAQALGHAAKLISELVGIPGGTAFSAGLLHNAGVLASAVAVTTPALWSSAEPRDAVLHLASRYHALLAHVVCEAWALPEVLQDALLFHHRYDMPMTPVGAALVLAECLLDTLGLSRSQHLAGLAVKDRAQEATACDLLGLDLADVLDVAPTLEKRLTAA